ncbi:MAG TPA: protein-disulfide reductase DsbD domain-containing protein [Terriglobia bacterium]|nr:protein-disulfide reductase DsbD domain-containing protein [Terriglobia bacterium]
MRIVRHGCSKMAETVLVPLLVLLFSSSAVCKLDKNADTHGTLQLISENQFAEPGHKFWIGLRFTLEKGWHIYWLNPGDSGEPPKVNWELPAGFRAGELQWPAPHRLEHPPLTDFGYEDEVLLLAQVNPAAGLATGGGNTVLAADVEWVVCREVCIASHKRVTLPLAIERGAPKVDPNWRVLFERTRAQLPKPAPLNWKSTVLTEEKDFVLSIETGASEANATFFPLEELQIEDAAPQRASSTRRGVRLTLEKSDQLLKPIKNLKGVIVLGNNRAYLIDAPVFHNKRGTSS